MAPRSGRHNANYCAPFPRGLGDCGMSHSRMRGNPALPTAIAMPMRMVIQRAPNQVI